MTVMHATADGRSSMKQAPTCDAMNATSDFRDGRSCMLPGPPPPDANNLTFAQWQKQLADADVPLSVTAHRDDIPFSGDIASRSLGAVHLSEVSGGACELVRTAEDISRSDPGLLKVSLQLQGQCVLTQDGRTTTMAIGDYALYDTSKQYRLSFNTAFKCLVVIFPRDLLPLKPAELADFTVRRVSGRLGLGGLVAPFLQSLAAMIHADQLQTNHELSSAVVNLIAASLYDQLHYDDEPSETHRQALVLRVKAFVDARLGDSELNSATIAAAHHISLRYLQKLFEAEGTTVSDWIRRRRLERCRAELTDPRSDGTSIGAIASRWGFIDSSYFSRVFKATYGTSPRDYRAGAAPE